MAATINRQERKSIFDALVAAAITAPSPDNNQPWLFQESEQGIAVYLDPSRSLPSDVQSMFDMTAIGAATENAVIAAAEYGLLSELIWTGDETQPKPSNSPVVELRLQPGGTSDRLHAYIDQRSTCRRPYSSTPLAAETLSELTESCEGFPEIRIDWISTPQDKKAFGKLIALTDALRFQHRPFHEELFRQLRFHPSEVESTRDGLDVRTLELPFGVTTVLKWLRSWQVMTLVHQLGLTPLLTAPSALSVQNSGAIAVVSVSVANAKAFFIGGRAIQRLWLAGTSLGLSMHPLGSLPIFLLQGDSPPSFQPAIERARRGVHELLPQLKSRVIQLALRVGHSKPPSERSKRRPPSDVLIQ